MCRKTMIKHRLRRCRTGAAILVVFTLIAINCLKDDFHINKRLDNNYEFIMLEPQNDVDKPILININTASAHQLQRLDGIGETTAAAVIEYREKNGSFRSIDELVGVKGIGEKTLEKIRSSITV